MLLRVLCVCVSVIGALTLSGCAVHPLPDQVTRESTLAIVTAIRCEAQAAILEYAPSPAFDKSAIGFVFDFNITEHNHAGLDLTLHKSFPHGTFDLTVAGSKSDLMRSAQRKFTLIDHFSELKQAKCSQEALQSRFDYPIAGSIGLNEVIRTAIGIDQLGKLKAVEPDIFLPSDPGGGAAVFSDVLTYTTTFDTGTITPQLNLNDVPGVFRLQSASANLLSSRQDMHTLTLAIALTEPPKPTPKALVRAAARTALRAMPMVQALVSTRGVPSKVLIHSEPDPKVRVLWELDRRILLNQDDRLINALGLGLQR